MVCDRCSQQYPIQELVVLCFNRLPLRYHCRKVCKACHPDNCHRNDKPFGVGVKWSSWWSSWPADLYLSKGGRWWRPTPVWTSAMGFFGTQKDIKFNHSFYWKCVAIGLATGFVIIVIIVVAVIATYDGEVWRDSSAIPYQSRSLQSVAYSLTLIIPNSPPSIT